MKTELDGWECEFGKESPTVWFLRVCKSGDAKKIPYPGVIVLGRTLLDCIKQKDIVLQDVVDMGQRHSWIKSLVEDAIRKENANEHNSNG